MIRPRTIIRHEGWFYLAIMAVVFSGAMFKEINLLLILSGMMLGPMLFHWQAVTANLRGLHLERKLPLALSAGDFLTTGIILSNTRRRFGAWGILVEEPIRRISAAANHASPPLRLEVLFPYVPAGELRKGQYRGRLLERGRYELGPMLLSTRFPFGLFSRTIPVGAPETLVVLPRLGQLTEGWAARRLEAFAGKDRRRQRPGTDGDFFGVRQWQSGDGQRLVHWRTSARLGTLVVRQFERPRSRDVAVVLDLWQPLAPEAKHRKNIELAVSFTATVLADACRQGGSSVTLALHNSQPDCFSGPASAALLQQLMERLAVVEATSHDALPELLSESLRSITGGTEIVLVSTRPLDIHDPERFLTIWSDPVLRERAGRIRVVDASSPALGKVFKTRD